MRHRSGKLFLGKLPPRPGFRENGTKVICYARARKTYPHCEQRAGRIPAAIEIPAGIKKQHKIAGYKKARRPIGRRRCVRAFNTLGNVFESGRSLRRRACAMYVKAASAITRRQRSACETAACASSVWVTTAFARESSYHNAIDGDCGVLARIVCESSYHGGGMLVQSMRQ